MNRLTAAELSQSSVRILKAVALISAWLMVASCVFPVFFSSVSAQADKSPYKYKTTWNDGQKVKNITFDSPAQVSLSSLTFENNSFVVDGLINLTGDMLGDDDLAYPYAPSIQMEKENNTIWAWEGTGYGKLGYQYLFSDGLGERILTTGTGYTVRHDQVILPKEANVTSAFITLYSQVQPVWTPEEVISPIDSGALEGENLFPSLISFNGDIYAVWCSSDRTITTGYDRDVVLAKFNRSSQKFDRIWEVSPSYDNYDDSEVVATVYDNKIWIAWTNDRDSVYESYGDIRIRYFDGESFGTVINITSTYLYDDDSPNLIVYDNRLFLFFRTCDPSISYGPDFDFVYLTYHNVTNQWSGITDISPHTYGTSRDDHRYMDWDICLVIFQNKLGVIMDSPDQTINGDPNALIWDHDIFVRWYNGTSWSNWQEITPSNDANPSVGNYAYDQIPTACVWYNPLKRREELVVAWLTDNGCSDDQLDDIVYSIYDGVSWSPMAWISKPNDDRSDVYPQLIAYNGRLVCIWEKGWNISEGQTDEGNTNTYNPRGDIFTRSYDGVSWDIEQELTADLYKRDNANNPSLQVIDGMLWGVWDVNWTKGSKDVGKIVLRRMYLPPVNKTIAFAGDSNPLSFTTDQIMTFVNLKPEVINRYLQTATPVIDKWGNKVVRVPFNLSTNSTTRIELTQLTIYYDWNVKVNITEPLNTFLHAVRIPLNSRADDDHTAQFWLSSQSQGVIRNLTVYVKYLVNHEPVFLGPKNFYMEEDTWNYSVIDLNELFEDDFSKGNLTFEIISIEPSGVVQFRHNRTGTRYTLDTGPLIPNWYGVVNFTIRCWDQQGLSNTSY
ncbi:MAG: hypothetical protein QW728_07610, partial [Thermoplasmata archaeon]